MTVPESTAFQTGILIEPGNMPLSVTPCWSGSTTMVDDLDLRSVAFAIFMSIDSGIAGMMISEILITNATAHTQQKSKTPKLQDEWT